MSRKYEKVQELLPAIKEMIKEGKTHREIAEHFGLSDKGVVKELLKRERRKEDKIAHGIFPRPKGRPPKNAVARHTLAEMEYEIYRLKMENELLRDFLSLVERK